MRLYAATGDGIVRVDEAGEGWTVEGSLPDSGAQCLAVDPADPDGVYAGLRTGGVRRSVDGGRSWVDCTLPEPGVFSLAVSAADGAVYAGTEPSRLFRSDDRGERWSAPSPHDADLLLVGIELGGLMRSTDRGQSWQDHRPGAQPDVHSLAWHPDAPGRAYEAGGGGAAFSTDAGETWQRADDGLDRHYTWSVAVDSDCWYISASIGPWAAHGRGDPQAHIYRQRHGEPWQPLTGGLPEPLPAMPYALLATDGRLLAGLADGQLWETRDQGESWSPLRLNGDAPEALVALG